jgi:streptogramin lyase
LKYAVNDLESDCFGSIWCALDGGGLLEIAPNGGYSLYNASSTGGDLPQDDLQEIEIHGRTIWIATADSGIVKADGLIQWDLNRSITETNSHLPYNQVYAIDFDNNGNIWFSGMEDALGFAKVSVLSRDLSTWTVYDAQDSDLGLDQLEDRVFYTAVDDRNNKWFCTHYGVSYQLEDGTADHVAFTLNEYTRTVQADCYGNVYISQRESNRADARIHVSSDYGATWNQWSLTDIGMDIPPDSARPEIYDLRYDSKGQLWICTWYGVTYRKLDGTWDMIDETRKDYTYAMTIDPDDHVWVPDRDTYDLYEITEASLTVHDSTTIEPLKYAVNDLESDCQGHIWCATDGGGLLEIIPGHGYEQYTTASTGGLLLQDELQEIEINCGTLWIAMADSGIVRIAYSENLISTGVNFDDHTSIPDDFVLHDNFPNPFNPTTEIRFDLKKNADLKLSIFDIRGRLVSVLVNMNMKAGSHQITWNGRDRQGRLMPSGVYIYQLQAGDVRLSSKMMLIK